MIIMLDAPQGFTDDAKRRWPEVQFGQLRTPLTRRKRNDERVWALDNGCFSRFDQKTWLKMVKEANTAGDRAEFVCLPDCVGSAKRTCEMFDHYINYTQLVRRALVLQDGIGQERIRWVKLEAVFVGGSTEFKTSPEAFQAAKAAKAMGKWVHVGRVNTVERLQAWIGIADSIDGSGISRYSHMLDAVCSELTGRKQDADCEFLK
jgi:hypothetical protein